MGAEKGGSKGGGFFNLFDWNRKSRKKLFSISPESTKQEKRNEENLATTRLRLVDDDEIAGVSSGKGSSDYSCASSVTDEEGAAHRAPGVVARLMGLDSMPMSGLSEPSSTPFFDTRSLIDKASHKRSPELYINDQLNHLVHRCDGYARRPMEPRSQKMPSSPIERFQTETLPPRSGKSIPMNHHKLLSPIKNPGFISARNAAHIMEAAAKILDPGNQPNTSSKVSSFAPSSVPLRVRDSKVNMGFPQSQRPSATVEPARTPVDSTNFRYLRGDALNRSWNGSEGTSVSRRSLDNVDPNPTDVKGKGKSVSLAIQAKVNVQRREGLSSSARNSLAQREHDECKFTQTFKSQPNSTKNKQQKKPSAANSSGVLRQNNQKQNCISGKGKVSSKQSVSNQQSRKVLAGETSSTKSYTSSKLSGSSRAAHRKECADGTDFEREGSSSTNKDFPRKKRLIERGFVTEKSAFIDNVLVNRHHQVKPNVVIDEHSHSRWKKDNRCDGADVVSFTFTSPLIKPMSVSRLSTQVEENMEKGKLFCFDTHNQKKDEEENEKKIYSHGLNVISGDALSLLLEQKLRELTAGVESSSDSSVKVGSFTNSSAISEEAPSDINSTDTAAIEHESGFQHLLGNKPGTVFGYSVSSINGQVYGASKMQEVQSFSSSSDARKELGHQDASPFSVFEASFSNESFSDSNDGCKTCLSSVQAQNDISFKSGKTNVSIEADTELSDSASSTLTDNSDVRELAEESRTKYISYNFDYVREIVSNLAPASSASGVDPFVIAGEKLNPFLFEKLENKRKGDDRDGRLKRKALFDCVNECLDSKCSQYFRTSYRAWARGAAAVSNVSLAKDVYDEISGWRSMGDWMVDELVDKDMSSHLGRWVDYEIEAFEAGAEIEREIFSSMVDEVIADCFLKGPLL